MKKRKKKWKKKRMPMKFFLCPFQDRKSRYMFLI